MATAMADRHLLNLGRLKSIDIDGLKAAWSAAFKSVPPRAAHREFFVRILAYELQVRAKGGLRKPSLKVLRELAQTKSSAEQIIASETKLRAGTRLLRQWGGVAHEVMVMERG